MPDKHSHNGCWPPFVVRWPDVAALLANDQRPMTNDYNPRMLDEIAFRKHADTALASLMQSLITAEESADIEVEDQSGALQVSFADGTRFVISPNAPVQQ